MYEGVGRKDKRWREIEVKKGIFNAKGAEISQNGTSGVNFGVTEEKIGISSSRGGNMCFWPLNRLLSPSR